MQGDVRRVVVGPDGSRYEVVGIAKDWKLGTGSVLLDAAARRSRAVSYRCATHRSDHGSAGLIPHRVVRSVSRYARLARRHPVFHLVLPDQRCIRSSPCGEAE